MSSSDYGQVLRADILTYIWNLNVDSYKISESFYFSFKSPIFNGGINNEWSLRLTLNKRMILLEILDWNMLPNIGPTFEFIILDSDLQAFQRAEFEQVNVYKNEYEDTIKYQKSLKFSINDFLLNNEDQQTCNTKIRIMLEHKVNYDILKMINFPYHVLMDFEVLLDDENNHDVVLKVKGQDLKAHKVILSARSPVFSAMFRQNMIEKEQNIVKINDIRYDVMKEVLRFIYCTEIINLKKLAIDLLVVADKYDIDDLKEVAEHSLSESLTIENVDKVLLMAYLHGSSELLYTAADFTVRNYKHFGKGRYGSNFNSLSSLPPKLLSKLFLYACRSKQ